MKIIQASWWAVLLRGIALLLLGLFAIAWPGISIIIMSYVFALYILISGVLHTIHGIQGITAKRKAWFVSLLLGLAQIAVSAYVLQAPGLTLATFILVIGFSFLMQGVMEIVVAFIDKDSTMRILDVIGGILAIIAGFFILRYPVTGGIAFAWVIGVYGLVVGSLTIAAALSLHELLEEVISEKSGRRKVAV